MNDQRRARFRRVAAVVSIALGLPAVIVMIGVIVTSVETEKEPVIGCGSSAIALVMGIEAPDGPPARHDECLDNAVAQVFGGAVLAAPVFALAGWPLVARAERRADAASLRSGVWRWRMWIRVQAWAGEGLVLIAVVAAAVRGDRPAGPIIAAALLLASAASLYRFALRPRVAIGQSHVTIVNPFRTYVVPFSDIRLLQYFSHRLLVVTQSSTRHEIVVARRSQWAAVRDRRGRGHQLAEAILAAKHEPTVEPDPTDAPQFSGAIVWTDHTARDLTGPTDEPTDDTA